jgi:hypothetical protein
VSLALSFSGCDPHRNFKCLSINPGPEALLGFTLDHLRSPQTHGSGLCTHFVAKVHLIHTHSHAGIQLLLPLPAPRSHGFTFAQGYLGDSRR